VIPKKQKTKLTLSQIYLITLYVEYPDATIYYIMYTVNTRQTNVSG